MRVVYIVALSLASTVLVAGLASATHVTKCPGGDSVEIEEDYVCVSTANSISDICAEQHQGIGPVDHWGSCYEHTVLVDSPVVCGICEIAD